MQSLGGRNEKVARCRFCKRPLKTPKARRLGAGTTCQRKFPGYVSQKKLENQGQLPLFGRKSGAECRRRFKVKKAPPKN